MLTLAEYLRELKLMARQYGQEEDLYPLIYMVLWKKFGDLSVRVVEDAGHGEEKLKVFFSGEEYNTRPDMVVLARDFDKNFNKDNPPVDKRYGCIEVKTFRGNKDEKADRDHIEIFNLLNKIGTDNNGEVRITLVYSSKEYVDIKYGSGRSRKSKSFELKNTVEIDGNVINYSDISKILNESVEKSDSLDEFRGEGHKDDQKMSVRIRTVKKLEKVTACKKDAEEVWDNCSHRDIKEFWNELCLYRKVLYTNGLRWFYIDSKQESGESEKNNGEISLTVNCTEIGNLKELFEDIKSIDEVDTKVEASKWQQKWDRLNEYLAHINWTRENNKEQFILKEDRNANQTDTP